MKRSLRNIIRHIGHRVIDEVAEAVGLDDGDGGDPADRPTVKITPKQPPAAPAPAQPEEEPGAELTDLRKEALAARTVRVDLASGKDGIRWDIATKQLMWESDFAAFCMAWWAHVDLPQPVTMAEISRRALIAATVFHDMPIDDLPPELRKMTGE